MAEGDYKPIIAPRLSQQLRELGVEAQAKAAIRDAMADPEQAGKQLVGSFFPYRRLKMGRYRIIYRVVRDANPPEVHFLYVGMRKAGDKKDVYARLEKILNRDDLD